MLREIRELGFDHAELSHGIRLSLVPGILEAVDAGEIKISSLHNFCPLPMGVMNAAPNLYQFSAGEDRDRELAVKHTLKTLEFASRVKASVGGAAPRQHRDEGLHRQTEQTARDAIRKISPKFEKLRAEALKTCEAKKEKFFARMKETLRHILPEAEKRGIKLGCENRQALEELPLDGDFENFLKEFPSPSVAYWHDAGHAQIKENFGIIQHTKFLETLSPRLAGFHIHDVIFPARDHSAPGNGTIDYAALKPFVKPEHIKVFELSPSSCPTPSRPALRM